VATGGVSTAIRRPGRLARRLRLGRTHGLGRVFYGGLRRSIGLCRLEGWVRLCVVEVWAAPVAELKRAGRVPRVFDVRRATSEDLPRLEAFFNCPERVRERLGRGDVCAVTLAGGEICAGVWLSAGPGEYLEDRESLGCSVRFPAGVAWSYDGKGTRPGAWGALMARLPGLLEQLGAAEVFTLIDCNNWNSIRGHESLGYECAGLVGSAGVFGLGATLSKPRRGRWRRLPGRVGKLELAGKAQPF
jgi:hypothetical protein